MAAVVLTPGLSLGSFSLGSSLHDVLSTVKDDRQLYPAIDLHYSQSDPVNAPVILTLPENGTRLRFDGADQRLRLIEVLDFRKIKITYKGSELTKASDQGSVTAGPAFKRLYQIFGASFPGQYLAPKGEHSSIGTYVLSWPGVTFTFPLQHSAWSAEKDHVSLLGSYAASLAANMAVFEGKSWPEAQHQLFVSHPTTSRLASAGARPKDNFLVDIEACHVLGDGRIEFKRRHSAASFSIVLQETTLQDLITELGPPQTTYKREEPLAENPDPNARQRAGSSGRPPSSGRAHPGSQPSSYSSTGTDTYDADFDSGDADDDPAERASRERYWCYFSHGMDILVGPPGGETTNHAGSHHASFPSATNTQLVVLRVVIHGNVPGSYAFNRHRRLRWIASLSSTSATAGKNEPSALTAEMNFERDIKPQLMRHFSGVWPESEMGRGKVVNRTWGGSPSDSSFFLPDAGEDLVEGGGSEQWLGNTRLYAFPGLVFEVLESGAVSAVTVC